jgi:hypothetical protein
MDREKSREQSDQELIEELQLITRPLIADAHEGWKDISAAAEIFKANHPEDFQKYKLYQVLVGGSPDDDRIPELDTSDRELERIIRNLGSKKEQAA